MQNGNKEELNFTSIIPPPGPALLNTKRGTVQVERVTLSVEENPSLHQKTVRINK